VTWPNDADGDALQRLEDNGLDFAVPHTVDFNVDFATWPPAKEVIAQLEQVFSHLELCAPEDGLPGYVLLQVRGQLTYEWVTTVQREVTALVGPHGGVCESWGLLQ
jgi:hypothetical protein